MIMKILAYLQPEPFSCMFYIVCHCLAIFGTATFGRGNAFGAATDPMELDNTVQGTGHTCEL